LESFGVSWYFFNLLSVLCDFSRQLILPVIKPYPRELDPFSSAKFYVACLMPNRKRRPWFRPQIVVISCLTLYECVSVRCASRETHSDSTTQNLSLDYNTTMPTISSAKLPLPRFSFSEISDVLTLPLIRCLISFIPEFVSSGCQWFAAELGLGGQWWKSVGWNLITSG